MSEYNGGVDGGKFSEAILLKTIAHGRNGGRTYYIHADSPHDCNELAIKISKLARAAARRTEAKSPVAKIRLFARDIFGSQYFQMTSAFLILMVRYFFPFKIKTNGKSILRLYLPKRMYPLN